jgi:hypothetical protein
LSGVDSQPKYAYNVGRQQARQAVQIDLIRALAAIVVALIFLGAFGLTPRPVEPLISPTEPALLESTDSPTALSRRLPQPICLTCRSAPPPSKRPRQEPSPLPTTAPGETDAPTAVPPNTPQPASRYGRGQQRRRCVAARCTPGTSGEQLEWLLDGTVLNLLDAQETADGLLWQQVQTETGLVGWVAADFILISE